MQNAIIDKTHMCCPKTQHSKQNKAQKKAVEFQTSLRKLVKYTIKLYTCIAYVHGPRAALKKMQSKKIPAENKFNFLKSSNAI